MMKAVKDIREYKTFSELTTEAAEKAIKDDQLFSMEMPWGRSMDPKKIKTLFHPNGYPTRLTVDARKVIPVFGPSLL